MLVMLEGELEFAGVIGAGNKKVLPLNAGGSDAYW